MGRGRNKRIMGEYLVKMRRMKIRGKKIGELRKILQKVNGMQNMELDSSNKNKSLKVRQQKKVVCNQKAV